MRSSGYKMTRNFHNFLRILSVTPETFVNLQTTEEQAIFELRSIAAKYQPLEQIKQDLEEVYAAENEPAANNEEA